MLHSAVNDEGCDSEGFGNPSHSDVDIGGGEDDDDIWGDEENAR
jgi:hypothetical protein